MMPIFSFFYSKRANRSRDSGILPSPPRWMVLCSGSTDVDDNDKNKLIEPSWWAHTCLLLQCDRTNVGLPLRYTVRETVPTASCSISYSCVGVAVGSASGVRYLQSGESGFLRQTSGPVVLDVWGARTVQCWCKLRWPRRGVIVLACVVFAMCVVSCTFVMDFLMYDLRQPC